MLKTNYLCIVSVLLVVTGSLYGQPERLEIEEKQPLGIEKALSEKIRTARESVVSIEIFPRQGKKTIYSSGIIISEDGHIATVAESLFDYSKIIVKTIRGGKFQAKLVGQDQLSNIAILKISTGITKLVSVPDTLTDNTKIGSLLVVIGNSYGMKGTVGTGIISGQHRCVVTKRKNKIAGLIQTTAPIHPGDAGGIVIDSSGNFAGMASCTISRKVHYGSLEQVNFHQFFDIWQRFENDQMSQDELVKKLGGLSREVFGTVSSTDLKTNNPYEASGVNFVLPSNVVVHVAEQIIQYGHVKKGWLGIKVKNYDNGPGVVVTDKVLNGPGDLADIQIGDVLTTVGGQEISDALFLMHQVAYWPLAKKLPLVVIRNQKEITIMVSLKAKEPSLIGDK